MKLEDYHPENEELLLFDQQTREMLLVDQEGELISIFQPHKEGPNYVGDWDNGWTFYGDDELIAYGNVYFHRLTKDGARMERVPYPIETSSTWSLDYNPKMIHHYHQNDQERLMVVIPGATGPLFKTQAYQDSLRQFVTMDLVNGTHKRLKGKPEQSVYRTLGQFVDNGWPKVIQFKGSLFATTYAVDPRIYIRDMSNDSIVSVLDLPEDHHPEFTSIPYGNKGATDQTRVNSRIFATGDFIILESLNRIPKEVMRGIREIPDWSNSDEYEAARRQFASKHFLLFDQGQYLGVLDWNIGSIEYDMISSESGYLWAQRRYEDERDYRTFLKLKVVSNK